MLCPTKKEQTETHMISYKQSMFMFMTYDLGNELRGLRLPTDWQQSQAEVKNHKLLHRGEVLLTEPGVLHQHQLLETTAAL